MGAVHTIKRARERSQLLEAVPYSIHTLLTAMARTLPIRAGFCVDKIKRAMAAGELFRVYVCNYACN